MEVSSRRLAIVQHCHLPARGLLSLLSLLSAFSLTGINWNQLLTSGMHRHLPARGLLSLLSLLRAFLLTAIKRNQVTAHRDEKPCPVVPVAEARSAPQVHWGRSPKGGIRERQALRRAAAVSVSSVASRGVRAGPSILFLRERSQRRSKGMKAMDARYAAGEHSTGVFRRHSYGQVFFVETAFSGR